MPDGASADQDRQVLGSQVESLPVHLAGLEGEGPQPQGDGEAGAALGGRQSIANAAIGQGLAAAGGCHVDAEESLSGGGVSQGAGQVMGPVLPLIGWVGLPFAETLVAGDAGQAAVQVGQGAGNAGGVELNADQVFIQPLVELPLLGVGVGREAGIAEARVAQLVRVIVVRQDQGQTGQMDHLGIVQPPVLQQVRVLQRGLGDEFGPFPPTGAGAG